MAGANLNFDTFRESGIEGKNNGNWTLVAVSIFPGGRISQSNVSWTEKKTFRGNMRIFKWTLLFPTSARTVERSFHGKGLNQAVKKYLLFFFSKRRKLYINHFPENIEVPKTFE